MNDKSTQKTDDSLTHLLESLDAWIEDALKNSKPIGLTLSRARMTITDQYDRICELWDALDTVRSQRDEMRTLVNQMENELAAMNSTYTEIPHIINRPTPETDAACDETYAQGVAYIPLVGFMEKLERERDEALAEGLEQARLLGMSSEREAKLLAQLAAERALANRLAGELESWAAIAGDQTPMDADKAIAAWKEARND